MKCRMNWCCCCYLFLFLLWLFSSFFSASILTQCKCKCCLLCSFWPNDDYYDSRNIYYGRKFLMTILFRYTSISFALYTHSIPMMDFIYFACESTFYRLDLIKKYFLISCVCLFARFLYCLCTVVYFLLLLFILCMFCISGTVYSIGFFLYSLHSTFGIFLYLNRIYIFHFTKKTEKTKNKIKNKIGTICVVLCCCSQAHCAPCT